ncbi:pyridoxal-phosphate-dependent aminotransferase family protein [Halothermothrix orenii]|uniref:L-aspartate aminotransferasephosphoserine aminotransferase n=1 Tax=Halothermothrix orenii (strain H 168 / OCM 544 / DSM 9562) TaxID=373903 RepID=B8CX86_HALOH|nr:alanine--glyoxylate aminotransferase family protein [Halothermothrix orenii]ACL69905.1 L-aspartate aminotransferase;phosphoserine aminotransferase [Halothermothrix orenii H 168]
MNEQIRLPGPTPVPPEGLTAQSRQIIGHREDDFSKLLVRVTENLKKVFETKNDVLIFPASGTGGLEIAVVNILSPGDKILSVNNGVFGHRFRNIAKTFGAEIIDLSYPWGQPCNFVEFEQTLKKHPDIKAVLFTHNETSTCVQNNLEKAGQIVKNHNAVLLVDAVSSLGGLPVKCDDWNLDIVVTSSQKALMTPPGLAILSVSPKAWKQIRSSSFPVFYWDLKKAKKYYDERQQTPYTPPVSLLYALDMALKRILREGLDKVYKRHKLLTKALRKGMVKLGFKPFVPWEIASYTVSAFYQPEFVGYSLFKEHLYKKYKIHFANGQGNLKSKIFRIGHMGYVSSNDILKTIEIFGKGLKDFNINTDLDVALSDCKEVLRGVEEYV